MKPHTLTLSLLVAVPLLALSLRAEEATPTSPLAAFFGEELVNAKGETQAVSGVKAEKIGIYFSAQWCPPCRAFTPSLVNFYKELQADGKPFEIVFISSDRNAELMQKYMTEAKMPWLAVPFGSPAKEALAERFQVRGIPTLVVVDREGKTLSTKGRMEVATQGKAAFANW